jgi:hypothetical protein
MIWTDAIGKAKIQIEVSLTVLEARPLRLKTDAVAADLEWSRASDELNLFGSQVLIGMSVLSVAGLLMWALLKLWLFELQ